MSKANDSFAYQKERSITSLSVGSFKSYIHYSKEMTQNGNGKREMQHDNDVCGN